MTRPVPQHAELHARWGKARLRLRVDVTPAGLNDYHHDKYDIPAADVLRNAWDTSEPLFIAIYGAP